MPTEGNDSGNPTPGQEGGNDKVVFTEAQQSKVNELIQHAMGRAGSEHRERAASLEAELNAARAELKAAKEAVAAAKTPGDKSAAKNDLDRLQVQLEEMRNAHLSVQEEAKRYREIAEARAKEVELAKQDSINTRKQVAITAAASKQNFIDPTVAMKLTEDNIKYDEKAGRFVVLGDKGQERMNASLEPMTLEEYYQEFAAKNPYLVRGDVTPGIGSTTSRRFDVSNNGQYKVTDIFGKGSSSIKASALMKENPTEYHRLKQIAVDQGIIPGKKR